MLGNARARSGVPRFFDVEIATHYRDLTSTLCTTFSVTAEFTFSTSFYLSPAVLLRRGDAIHGRSYITNFSRN